MIMHIRSYLVHDDIDRQSLQSRTPTNERNEKGAASLTFVSNVTTGCK
jgi:hypothetical protein